MTHLEQPCITTPKEKADKLIEDFKISEMHIRQAINYSLITVKEVIKTLADSTDKDYQKLSFWYDVKSELEHL